MAVFLVCKGSENFMAKSYYRLIKAGRRTIEDVPEILKAEVQALLDADSEVEEG